MIIKSGNSKIIVGYDLGKHNSQISYFSADTSKVETAPSVAGTQIYNIPTVLCKKYGVNQWLYGKEAIRAANEEEGILVDDLLTLALDGEPIQIEGEPYAPEALLTLFIKKSLSMLSMAGPIDKIGAFLITCEEMDPRLMEVLSGVLAGVGLKARHICFQNYEESFYQYMIHQQEDLMRFRTVMFLWEDGVVKAYGMECNEKTTPKAVFVSREDYEFPRTTAKDIGEDGKVLQGRQEQMDNTFLRMAENVCKNDRISAVYLIGEGFDREWMTQTLRFLCQGRRVFLGSNLFSQGACLGMMERLKASNAGREHVLLGKDKLKANIGMRVLRRGEYSYVALLDAGTAWYEAVMDRECYLKDENAFELVVAPLNGMKGKIAQMTLEGLPTGTNRVHLHLEMLSESRLSVSAEDLGFGEFRQASHQVWREEMELF